MPPIQDGDSSGTDKRKNRRVPLRVPIECRSLQVAVNGRAENVSIAGLLVRTEQTFEQGEEVSLSFALPGSEQTVRLRARVAHIVPDVFMGLEFLELTPESQALLETYIAATPVPPIKAPIKK